MRACICSCLYTRFDPICNGLKDVAGWELVQIVFAFFLKLIGFGLRYDFSFFVVRLDFGFKTYNPAELAAKKWFRDYNFSHGVVNIGINYPF